MIYLTGIDSDTDSEEEDSEVSRNKRDLRFGPPSISVVIILVTTRDIR
jgi:hypothetical protein